MAKKSAVGDGGPAFPVANQEAHSSSWGMSLRDYFAAKTLAAVIQSSNDAFKNPDKAAAWSYEWADAMLKAREAK